MKYMKFDKFNFIFTLFKGYKKIFSYVYCLLKFSRPPQDFASGSVLVSFLFYANDKRVHETKFYSHLHCLPSSIVRLTMIL
jgi:hypothetical protein